MDRLNRSEQIFKIISYVLLAVFAIMALYPLIYAFSASISGKLAYEAGDVVLFPKDLNFQVYNLLYTDKSFWIAYINTFFYTIFGTAWSMFISLTGAYALSKTNLLFRSKWNFLVVFPMWFSAGMVPMYLNYVNMGVDNRWGMVFAFGIQAYNIILLRSYFQSVPSEIEESARIDGATEFSIFTKIYIPMSKASIATVTLFYATSRWNGYFWSRMLLTAPGEQPLQVYMRTQIENFQAMFDNMPVNLSYSEDSYLYAILVCSIIPVLLIYPSIQKYFAKGANLGGVKG